MTMFLHTDTTHIYRLYWIKCRSVVDEDTGAVDPWGKERGPGTLGPARV